ncbi:hypothetical protein Jann_0681 [Jannaschia sp. CCS1]|nr:hypothetical protein Jann_0681 [Jannaschia sp. CCS1]
MPDAVKHYLERSGALLDIVAQHADADRLLSDRIAPDMFDAGLNLAIAIRFAARALCPPAQIAVPEIPESFTMATLRPYHSKITRHIAPITGGDLIHTVTHNAGNATLTQAPMDYIARFALPNQIFHLTATYAALRGAGVALGKADFDGLHVY